MGEGTVMSRADKIKWNIVAVVILAFYWEISSLREVQERQLRMLGNVNARLGSAFEHLDDAVRHLTIETNTDRIGQ